MNTSTVTFTIPKAADFTRRCLSIDLEVGIQDLRIHRFAAINGNNSRSFVYKEGNIQAALAGLDRFAKSADFLLGHNLIAFDLPHLDFANPSLRLLQLPPVDTLRLNPLAFPRNPYHHLVKHYQDGQLKRGQLNDPELDARLTLDVLQDQFNTLLMLNETEPGLLLAWHWLTTREKSSSGFDAFFSAIRRKSCPTDAQAQDAISIFWEELGCLTYSREILAEAKKNGWALAYCLAWLSVAGGNSVMPPWVVHQFPEARVLVSKFRDVACADPGCTWCRKRHNARHELNRWFGFDEFRPEPADEYGLSLQQVIVEAAMQGKNVLGILPTGTGKSLCYQIPALSRYEKTGALTVVVSPLVALMADQITGLEARGITSCAAINSLLSMPERADVLERLRLGDVGILIVSPEQLRNRTLRKVLQQRVIGFWVLDEAHCISKWGHDFRPDYRYMGRFIRETAVAGEIPPVMCLTATAKPDVREEIVGFFRDKVGVSLMVFDGGASRTNLDFAVVPTTPAEKFSHIHQLLLTTLLPDSPDGAIVYSATRKQTEEVAQFLRDKGMVAEHFHSKLPPETKKRVQAEFINGELPVICATNAFGMGIDKPDIRLVIHADIPGSLENYFQEAGRAGRDRAQARCVLLYTSDDVERQFGMSAHSQLHQSEIQAVLKALRNLDRKKKLGGEVVATAGEILIEEEEGAFQRDSATDDSRVRTAIAALEEAHHLCREENQVQVFPSSLRISSLEEARVKLERTVVGESYRRQLLLIVEAILNADSDEGISTDELMAISGLSTEKIRSALHDLEHLGIAANDTVLTAFVHVGVEKSSQKRFELAASLEISLINEMQVICPELDKGDSSCLHLRRATQHMKDLGHAQALPESIRRIIRSLSWDGRSEDGGVGSLQLRSLDAETMDIKLLRGWPALTKAARMRRTTSQLLLNHLLTCLPSGVRGTDLLVETTLGKLQNAIEADLILRAEIRNLPKIMDRSLLWLHEQEIIHLNKGLTVFRPAMTIRLSQDRRGFVKADFTPLRIHYDEQMVQIHVMSEYAERGLQKMADALRLAMDYFRLDREKFIKRWLPNREKELARKTTPQSWRKIVESLNNPLQQRIVADDREQTNVLVLAGPGSGKTRVLVHRIAYLIRVKRENPKGIIALAYNRHAAVQIRKRLADLIGDDARGVIVLTCHALAMRLVGISFAERKNVESDDFKKVIEEAAALLKGDSLLPAEADEHRDRLLAGFRWILVDEYQDIGPEQYQLISSLAGRSRYGEETRLNLFAVGDDDQNIYSFDGASVEFIRRFEADYRAKPVFLTENYRSSAHIITAANLVIGKAKDRMKAEHPITIDGLRRKIPAGGEWQSIDSTGRGRVQVLPAGAGPMMQAVAVMTELQRLSMLEREWSWAKAAVIAREWKILEPVRSYCELHNIPVQMADEDTLPFWKLRETQNLVNRLKEREIKTVDANIIKRLIGRQPSGFWWSLLQEAADEYSLETGGSELPAGHFIEWLAEWGREARRKQTGLLLLTAHRAKGLEFDHVVVLDGGWEKTGRNEDRDAQRRLYYVAMTRARQTLTLARFDRSHIFLDDLANESLFFRSQTILPPPAPELSRSYRRLTLRDVDLGYTGRYTPGHPVHQAVDSLTAGDRLQLQRRQDRWNLQDLHGRTVGRLSQSFTPPVGMDCVDARVTAVIIRRRADDEYPELIRCESWEVIVPELVFEPRYHKPLLDPRAPCI